MESELNYVLISVMITCAAFVGAVNSKGTARMIISYILAFVCLVITSVYITQLFTKVVKKGATQIAGEANKLLETKLEELEQLDQLEEQKTSEIQASADYRDKAGNLLKNMKRLAARLNNADMEPGTDAEYEQLQQNANAYLREMSTYQKEVKALSAPSGMASTHEKLTQASIALFTGCSSMKRFFNAENGEEEKRSAQTFRSQTRQASHLLSQAESELK